MLHFDPMFWWTLAGVFYLGSFSLMMMFFVASAELNERADELTEEFVRRLRGGEYAELRISA
jgi:hypothetical protein